jgi:hypothetical protein
MTGNRVWKFETLLALSLAAAWGNHIVYAHTQEKAKPVAQEKAAAEPVAVDAPFLETLADYQMIQREIARIENAKGTVEIPVSAAELHERADLKLAKLKAWMTDHKVPLDWQYEASLRSFIPPAAPAAKGEGKGK